MVLLAQCFSSVTARGAMPLSTWRAMVGEDFMAPMDILNVVFWMGPSLVRTEGAVDPYILLPYINFVLMVVR